MRSSWSRNARGAAIGYVYAGIEPFSWKEQRDAAGFVHDIVVDPSERRTGVAGALMEAAIAWVREQGVASVMLWTASPNEGAQRLFEGLGFRRTMVEMTRDALIRRKARLRARVGGPGCNASWHGPFYDLRSPRQPSSRSSTERRRVSWRASWPGA